MARSRLSGGSTTELSVTDYCRGRDGDVEGVTLGNDTCRSGVRLEFEIYSYFEGDSGLILTQWALLTRRGSGVCPTPSDSNRGRKCLHVLSISAVRDACRQHANQVMDTETQEQLRELADKFIVRALEIESKKYVPD